MEMTIVFKELILCFQKLFSGELHTFYLILGVSQTGYQTLGLGVRHLITSST